MVVRVVVMMDVHLSSACPCVHAGVGLDVRRRGGGRDVRWVSWSIGYRHSIARRSR